MSDLINSQDVMDVSETLELLERAVAEKGADYIYPKYEEGFTDGDTSSCVYRNTITDKPACVVGHVLAYRDLLDLTHDGNHLSIDGVSAIRLYFTERAINLLQAVQIAQDGDKPWGEALETGRAAL